MKIQRNDLVKRMLLVALSSLVVCLANAANVIWREGYEGQRFGWADWTGWGGPSDAWGLGISEVVGGMYFEVYFWMETFVDDGGASVRIHASDFLADIPFDPNYSGFVPVNVIQAESGGIISAANTNGRDNRYFFANGTDVGDELRRDYDIIIPLEGDRRFYFGLSIEMDPNRLYGWVEAQANENGELSSLAYAIDLDGGPMIVGGGPAIPEPSAALLLLVGGALLALRRRRTNPRI